MRPLGEEENFEDSVWGPPYLEVERRGDKWQGRARRIADKVGGRQEAEWSVV